MFFGILLSFVAAIQYPATPDRTRSPGSLCTFENKDFREYRYDERIPYCRRNVSSSTKRSIYDEYGIPEDDRTEYTIDHIIPLSIGGSNERGNLWPEHKEVKATRPNLEQTVYDALRKGDITQQEAIDAILDEKF